MDGPGFRSPIDVRTGQVVERDGFVFCDVFESGEKTAPFRGGCNLRAMPSCRFRVPLLGTSPPA